MSRTGILATIGVSAMAVGLFLIGRAAALTGPSGPAPTGRGLGGVSEPTLIDTYQAVGAVALFVGLVFTISALWRWAVDLPLRRGRRAARA